MKKEIQNLNKAELVQLAKSHSIKNASHLKKTDLQTRLEAIIHGKPKKSKGKGRETSLKLALKDPDWVVADWTLSPEAEKYIESLPHQTLIRVYDVTGVDFNGENDNRHWEIEVSLDAKTWYINFGNPGNTLVIDFGLKDSKGAFYLIARSDPISIPIDESEAPDSNTEDLFASSPTS